jgi:ribulose-phosphate 3-epimerase
MAHIIPTIFATDEETFNNKLEILSPISEVIHIDFMDADFVKNKSVQFDIIKKIKKYNNKFEVHFMAYDVTKYYRYVARINNINRIYIQCEAYSEDEELIKTIQKFNKKNIDCFLVLNPLTPIFVIERFAKYISGVMLMSVHPGKEGQEFLGSVLYKIRNVKRQFPKLLIGVDGGINENNVKDITDMGADFLYVGSSISRNENPKLKLEKLQKNCYKNS